MSEKKRENTGTLLEPDFSGYWSVCQLKGSKWYQKPIGGLVLLLLVGSWIGGFASPVIVLWLAPRYPLVAAIVVPLLVWQYIFPVKAMRAASRFWLLGAWWFDGGATMIFESARDPDDVSESTMGAYHPHGIFTLGVILNGGFRVAAADYDPKSDTWASYCGRIGPMMSVGLAAKSLVHAPIFGHIVAKWTGGIESADKKDMLRKMKNGDSFALIPGGFNEAGHMIYAKERIYIKRRAGFIKYALEHGYAILPAYSFGESTSYWNLPGGFKLRESISKMNLPSIVPCGTWWCPVLPKGDTGIHTVHYRVPRLACRWHFVHYL